MSLPRLLLVLALLLPSPALAHRLKVFAAVSDGAITGYAFFIGGGRPQGAQLSITDAAGAVVHEGATDAEGAFRWPLPEGAAAYTVTVNAQDGHVAQITLGGDAPAAAATPSPAEGQIEAVVAAAVARELLPLREQIAAMDSRMRLTDILSGIFLILGAAGGWLWLRRGQR